ncbi:kita-kyushu lung cancer antigen 1 [Tupaia chinensis]|uniref:kita-kyushu lung cancer antigen 1 n=1 Tax=Tupaia chinensis TaxID=246437 RepID=UPI0003C8E339|nr:kita-kyushu lung cancer antigen 1 [Tupaia chinensis]
MSLLLVLVICVVFASTLVFWKKRSQKNSGETSTSTALALIRPSSSSIGSTRSHIDNRLSVNNLSRDILNNFPHSIAMQKRILVNLRIVEYKLAEMEHFLINKGLNGVLVNRKPTESLTECKDSGSNH